ncbi:MAG: hypothetical protein IJ272_07865 [Clostridia bacterium]|nr:hypothetical protein [Clostridia bacterium]
MGFFDRFKKKEEQQGLKGQSTIHLPEPLEIKHSDERKDKIYFYGLKEVDGKILMSVGIEDGNNISDMYPPEYLVEPHYTPDENGNLIEDTEAYYRGMAVPPKKGGDRAKFIAIKGFFQPRDITKEKIGSNYIGGVVFVKEVSEYRRRYDETFRRKYIEKQRQAFSTQTADDIAKRQAALEQGTKLQGIYADMQKGKASQEDVNYYYAHTGRKTDNERAVKLSPDDLANRGNR